MGKDKLWWGSRTRPLKSQDGRPILEGRQALDWIKDQRGRGGATPPGTVADVGQDNMFENSDGSFTAVVGDHRPPGMGSVRSVTPVQVFKAAESDTWECENMEVKGECPIYKKQPAILVPYAFYLKWQQLALMHKVEWIAYLTGEWDGEAGEATIDDFYFPPQKVGQAHCEPIINSFDFRPRTIGTVHSHNTMNAFFSGTDIAHMNWQVEMVINSRGEMVGAMRLKFKCGEMGRSTTAKIRLGPAPTGEDPIADALSEALAKGKEQPATTQVSAEEEQGNVQGTGGHVGHVWPQ